MAGHLASRLNVVGGWLFVALWLLVVVDLGLQAPALRRLAEGVLALLILLAMLKASGGVASAAPVPDSLLSVISSSAPVPAP